MVSHEGLKLERITNVAMPLWAPYSLVAMARMLVLVNQRFFLSYNQKKNRSVERPMLQEKALAELEAIRRENGSASLMVFIPCLNEEMNISWVISEIAMYFPDAAILVIDDGSSDNTARRAHEAGAVVIRNETNRGIGYCLRYSFALALAAGYEKFVRLDGDGQHDPFYIGSLLRTMEETKADMVVGSRYCESDMEKKDTSTTPLRRKCRKIFSFMVRMHTGLHFNDPNSGYCACSRPAMRYLLERGLLDIPEVDMLISLGKAGFQVRESPVIMRPREAGRSSVNVWKVSGYLLSLFMKHYEEGFVPGFESYRAELDLEPIISDERVAALEFS